MMRTVFLRDRGEGARTIWKDTIYQEVRAILKVLAGLPYWKVVKFILRDPKIEKSVEIRGR